MARYKKLLLILNPVSGKAEPVIKPLHTVLTRRKITWDMRVTRSADEIESLIKNREPEVEAVAVYGGDGTQMRAAEVLAEEGVPMIVLPGGTSNVLATELGISQDLVTAMNQALRPQTTLLPVDLGEVNGKKFILRLVFGLEAEQVRMADRAMKDKFGPLAYAASTVKLLPKVPEIQYAITIDGKEFTESGILCRVDNSGSYGVKGLAMSSHTSVSDGMLDVIVVRKRNLKTLEGLAAHAFDLNRAKEHMFYKQGREIVIKTKKPELMVADGELIGETPAQVRVVPGAVKVVVASNRRPKSGGN